MSDALIAQVATKITYASAGSTVVFGLNVHQWGIVGVIVGIAITAGMAAFNIWFRMKYQRGE